jgi:uncharacterized protein YlxW (UPF0749 family)
MASRGAGLLAGHRPGGRDPATPDTPRPELPDQVVMPLLDRIVRQSLDEDYSAVAERRRAGPGAGAGGLSRRPRRVAAAVMALFGVLVAIAGVQTQRNAPEARSSRASLVDQIQERRTTVARLQDHLDRLRQTTIDLQAGITQRTADQQALAARIQRLQVGTGYGAVTGPGLRITVDDAPAADATQVVRDSDLRVLVDGLWSAGAEAISVNGKRLTALTAFRNVGPAIHIGITPLVPPYQLLVVGDPQTLAANLLDSTFGQEWYSLKDSLGFVFEIKSSNALSLPAAKPRRLRAATLLDDGSSGRPDTQAGTP